MYGDRPVWSPKLTGMRTRPRDHQRVHAPALLHAARAHRVRRKRARPARSRPACIPWYEVPGRVDRDLKIVCGHWSTLGLFIGHGVHMIDTGAVWGGKLTALQLDTDELRTRPGAGTRRAGAMPSAATPTQLASDHRAAASASGAT